MLYVPSLFSAACDPLHSVEDRWNDHFQETASITVGGYPSGELDLARGCSKMSPNKF